MKFMIDIDVLIYTPLEEEYESLKTQFLPQKDVNGSSYTGYKAVGRNNENILVAVGFEWGNDHAYRVVGEVLADYMPRIAVCIGIAGAISADAKLGNVIYSRQILDLTQRMKQEKDRKG